MNKNKCNWQYHNAYMITVIPLTELRFVDNVTTLSVVGPIRMRYMHDEHIKAQLCIKVQSFERGLQVWYLLHKYSH